MTESRSNFKKYTEYFHDMSIRLDQASKDGKTIVSVKTMASFSRALEELCKELERNVPTQ